MLITGINCVINSFRGKLNNVFLLFAPRAGVKSDSSGIERKSNFFFFNEYSV